MFCEVFLAEEVWSTQIETCVNLPNRSESWECTEKGSFLLGSKVCARVYGRGISLSLKKESCFILFLKV